MEFTFKVLEPRIKLFNILPYQTLIFKVTLSFLDQMAAITHLIAPHLIR